MKREKCGVEGFLKIFAFSIMAELFEVHFRSIPTIFFSRPDFSRPLILFPIVFKLHSHNEGDGKIIPLGVKIELKIK